MVISHKHKFIFIKTSKTAGTSIEVFLSLACGDSDILTPIYPHVPPHRPRNYEGFYNHISAEEVHLAVGDRIWNEYFKFCVERNPWDKTISYFYMLKGRGAADLTMDEYLRSNDFPVNYPKYTERQDQRKIIVDQVLRYEKLTEELEGVFGSLGIPFSGSLGVRAKSEYRTDRRRYQEILTPDQKELISELFEREIELHGYAYD